MNQQGSRLDLVNASNKTEKQEEFRGEQTILLWREGNSVGNKLVVRFPLLHQRPLAAL